MKDLLKEAIADAKAVRETALANAKLALEEAFTPRLQSMLSAKLAEEMSEEDEEMPAEEAPMEGEEMGSEEAPAQEAPAAEEAPAEEEAPVEEGEDEYAMEEGEETEDDLDLESIIRELEEEEGMEDEAPVEEGEEEMPAEEAPVEEGEEDEDIDINEIIRALREEDEEETMEEGEEESSNEDLEEAYNVIRFLKGKINEVNLLNAKLLYSNKLFRNFSLNEGQKMKVIENFDRAHNLREVKLVYSTLAEGFKMPSTKKVVKESFASKPVASTKPAKQVISEGTELANRFKKLAGLK
jgi:hypothetical protein